MQIVTEWRELLGEIIKNPEERKRLVHILGVTNITLTRWASGSSNPRLNKLQLLLDAFPQHHARLLKALQAEFPDFAPVQENAVRIGSSLDNIPETFYARFFKEYVMVNRRQRSWSLRDMILQQALKQLDPDEQGLAITIAQCTRPTEGKKVRTVRMILGLATPPWPRQVDMAALFLAGAESLAGYVIGSGRPVVVQGRAHQGIIPVHWVDKEESVAACPLLFSDRIAGCLTCSSTEPYFFDDACRALIQKYADLIVLTFEDSDFYTFEDLDLHFLPDYRIQLQHVSSMHELALDEMQEAIRNNSPITRDEAECRAWQRFEEKILRSSASALERRAHVAVGQKINQNHDR